MYGLIISAFLISLIMVGKLADKRGRSVVGWLCLSLLLTPFICAFVLLSTEKTDSRKKDLTTNQEGSYWVFTILCCAAFLVPFFFPSSFKWYDSASHADYELPRSSFESIYVRSFSCYSDKYEIIVENDSYKDITNVTFRVTYYKDNKQIDYHDYVYGSVIEKNMTKTCLFERGGEFPYKYDKVEIEIIAAVRIEDESEESSENSENTISL